MTVSQWLGLSLTLLLLALVMLAGVFAVLRRRREDALPKEGWLTDEMVGDIIRYGSLSGVFVPEEALDMDEISKEEERFWTETWDESEPYWD
jgi:hypothetical protein